MYMSYLKSNLSVPLHCTCVRALKRKRELTIVTNECDVESVEVVVDGTVDPSSTGGGVIVTEGDKANSSDWKVGMKMSKLFAF